ncbi:Sulfite dehydrogenase cytochrome subunit SoxD [Candidatus Rhodobacter oscarellae]|uniref:Sulfite dehydrogenase cytochrome subunit SoxD n=1 Tax=Candidatus Rhodobacter oscarellae TaxID=1675527 RepID=A0A0J9EGA7_9RHOB|nr:c-type cytochrome [Candidatus Rhodobacter lobularis]KMW60699.1 Sulfite dehydrogenase cytochrome subunit SoxD [Candidatus Rhodobacter lobularis]
MSKPLSIFLPALGVTGIVLGVAYGLSTRSYKAQEAAAALRAAMASEARVEALSAQMAEVEANAATMVTSLTAPAPAATGPLGLGRAAHPEELAAWDVDVLPDGRGLPEGSGDVLTGEEVFADKCASCHGDFAEGVDNWPVLAGGFDTLADEDPVKTVGSYWPYLSTVWDYVNRSMPFGEAQTLTADETYAIVAYILYSNDIVEDEAFILSHENFTAVQMHNTDGFVIDDRPGLEYAAWRAEPCMENCKDSVEITRRASMVNVTPLDEHMHPAMRGEMHASMAAPAEEDPQGAEQAAGDAALIATGETVFKKCKACHQVGDGAKNRSGPHLNGILGRRAGGVDGFKYSPAMSESGVTWDAETLASFLANPKGYLKGTKMSFRGIKEDEDLKAIIAYLNSVSQ